MSLISSSEIYKHVLFVLFCFIARRVYFDLFIEDMCHTLLGLKYTKSLHTLNLHPSMEGMKKTKKNKQTCILYQVGIIAIEKNSTVRGKDNDYPFNSLSETII